MKELVKSIKSFFVVYKSGNGQSMTVHYIGLGKTWKLIHQKWTFSEKNISWAKHSDSTVRVDINPFVQNRHEQEQGTNTRLSPKK